MAKQDPRAFMEESGYDINGIWYPRVTSIVGIKAKPALYRFYGELKSFDEGEKIKEKSATEGTLIHDTVEDLLIGKDVAIDPSVAPAVEAFQRFIETTHIFVDKDYIEKRIVHSSERYAGTVDALALIDGRFGVLDIKTSQAIYRDYNLQTAAYIAALIDELPTLQTRWILRIDQHQVCSLCGAKKRMKGGREKIRLPWQYREKARAQSCEHQWDDPIGEVELQEFPFWRSDYQAFLGAKKLWEWEYENVLKTIGYLL